MTFFLLQLKIFLKIKNFLNETSIELEDNINLIKTQGDFNYFNGNYVKALENYETSLCK